MEGQIATEASASRRALPGFVVSGLLLSFLGAILPAWGYHVRPHYETVGNYFLAVNCGIILASFVGKRLIGRLGAGPTLSLACSIAFAALVSLSLTAPPVSEWWRLPCLAGLGFAGGLLNIAIFYAISPAYRLNPAATVNLGGAFLGIGSCLAPLLIAGTFHLYHVSTILYILAMVPGFFAMFFARQRFPAVIVRQERPVSEVLREFTVPAAVFLSLLLFFHFGNEWAIAGWLPLLLTERLGMNPATALILLALYWFSLLIGRVAVQAILPRVSHWRMLFGGGVAALFGCMVLAFTNNLFGATMGTLLVGLAFAPVYPLVVERIGARFPHYHPGFFNGIFSIALTGGMLAPATLGYAAEYFGIRVVVALPAIGTFIVLLLVLAIWVESKIADWTSAKARGNGAAG